MVLHDIAVGLDGSSGSIDALRWASGLAEDLSARVRIVSAWRMPLLATIPSIVMTMPSPAFMASQAGEQIDKACAEVGTGQLPVQIIEGDAGAFLAAETEVADLVVIGRTGAGQRGPARLLSELMLGSTARYCLHHAHGPVAMVPTNTPWKPDPTVVVGIDGSPSSIAALRWAIETLPSATIHVIWAVPPHLEGLLALDHQFMDKILAATQNELDQAISAALGERDPASADIVPTVVVERARYALTRPGLAADLIVVGARGRSAGRTPLMGSTSDHVVRHALCPVVVVPPEKGTTE